MSDFASHYHLTKGRLIEKGSVYRKIQNSTYISFERIGRDNLLNQIKINNSPYCRRNSSAPVECFNLRGEKIAEFQSVMMASVLTGIPFSTINSSIKRKYNKKYTGNIAFNFKS